MILSCFIRDLKETNILKFQWQNWILKDSFYSLVQDSGKPCVIFYDRGVIHGSAYMTPEQCEGLKLEHHLDTVTLRETYVNLES